MKNRRYGTRGLKSLRDMFDVIHRRETMTPTGFGRRLKETGQDLIWQATRYVPSTREAKNLTSQGTSHRR